MKKSLIITTTLGVFLLFCNNAFSTATEITQTNAGEKLTIKDSASDFEFQPSSSVKINGGVADLGQKFAIVALHASTLDTDHGQAFAMASDKGGMYYKKLKGVTSATADDVKVTTYNSTGLGTAWIAIGQTATKAE